MVEKDLIQILNIQTDIKFAEDISMEDVRQKLAAFINDLIHNDFQKLISILYKVDVDETKLKSVLKQEAGRDSGEIISTLIIERQVQKLHSRRQFKPKNN